jgi:outer membrane protein assembly factor BamB
MSHTQRTCPRCGQVNHGQAEFCSACAGDLRAVKEEFLPWAHHHLLPPVAESLREDSRSFAHSDPDAPGAGLLWSGFLVATAGLLLDLSTKPLVLIVLAGVAMMAIGLWQLRIDYHGLSRFGFWLNGLAVIAVLIVAWRVVDPATANPVQLLQPRATATADANEGAAPEEAVLMHRGGPAHLGRNPGPAPQGSLYRAWRFDSGGELYSSPSISGDKLVIGSKSGFLYALDSVTGGLLWSRDLGEYIVRATPAIEGNTVYLNNGYQVLAIALGDGSTLWDTEVSFTGSTSPTVVNGRVIVASQSGGVYAFNGANGEQDWHIQIDGLLFGSPTVVDGRIYVANDQGKVYSIDLETGRVDWNAFVSGGVFAPVIADDGALILTTSDGATWLLNVSDGKEIWHYDAGGASGAAVTLDSIIVGSDNGGITAISRKTGEIQWLVPTGAPVTVPPTVVEGLVLVASGRTVYGLDLKTGEQRFTFATGYTIQISPVIVNERIYVGGRDGFLDAIAGNPPEPAAES